ncbi:MAG: efflux RND transporter periplasmic adaptor subunit [Woeseiaceae bacterium]
MSISRTLAARPWISALAIVALVAVWMLSGTVGDPVPENSDTMRNVTSDGAVLRSVQMEIQRAEPIVRYINVYGRSAPARTVDVKAETNGRVAAVGAARGRPAKAGEVIARLDLRDRRARLAQAKASVEEFETSYRAQLELQSEGYVSETEIAEIVAKLEGARTELVRAQLDLEYMTIRAPFDGALATREVEVGDFVRAGDVIGNFIDNTKLIVSASLAEQDAQYAVVGDEASAVLVTGQEVVGKIRFISPLADVATRTFEVEVEVPNPEGSLPAGVTAEIRIAAGTVMAHKISPSLLNLETDGTIGVKTLDDQDRVIFHPVEIARSQTDGIWVTGLPDTARIITVGQGYVLAGQVVEPHDNPAATAVAAGEANDIRN